MHFRVELLPLCKISWISLVIFTSGEGRVQVTTKSSRSYVTLCLVVFFFLVKAGEVRVKNFSNLRSHCFCIQNFFCFPDLLLRSFLDLLHGHDKRFSKASSTLQKFIFCLQIQRQNFEANWEDDI